MCQHMKYIVLAYWAWARYKAIYWAHAQFLLLFSCFLKKRQFDFANEIKIKQNQERERKNLNIYAQNNCSDSKWPFRSPFNTYVTYIRTHSYCIFCSEPKKNWIVPLFLQFSWLFSFEMKLSNQTMFYILSVK